MNRFASLLSSCCPDNSPLKSIHFTSKAATVYAPLAAFLCVSLLLGGCRDSGEDSPGDNEIAEAEPWKPAAICSSESTAISAIQGGGDRSPLVGQTVTASGVVTVTRDGEGVVIESIDTHNPSASKGIFVQDASLAASTMPGNRVTVTGTVAELGEGDTLTALTDLSEQGVCEQETDLPLHAVRLSKLREDSESLESMRLEVTDSFVVTDVYHLARGEIGLSTSRHLWIPTQVARPGKQADRTWHSNRESSINVKFSPQTAGFTRVGASVGSVTAVLGTHGRGPVLLSQSQPESKTLGAPVPVKPVDTALRVVNTNLQNFFNGDGRGGGFPAERGPESREEFEAKAERIRGAMEWLKPDIVAVQELENDGFGLGSAAASFIEVLNSATEDDWGVVAPLEGRIGSDAITVGLFYRRSRVETIGLPMVLDSEPFQYSSRQPLAQSFQDSVSGQSFLVVVNHFKSKGGCPEDKNDLNANQRDGQACWNKARTEAAAALTEWLASLPPAATKGGVLVVGDLNAYRMEDPLQVLRDAGFNDLLKSRGGPSQYTLVYRGQAGILDYALASEDLFPRVLTTEAWHINAGWPESRFIEGGKSLQYSDHNPVVVDLDFSQASTSD